jgi:diguanylate cyclase (GGDEF)-like protein/PAS domain S-box-containing protein
MVKIFGYESADDFVDMSVADWYQSASDRKNYLAMIKRIGSVKDLELPLKKRDGQPIWCSLTATAQVGDQGEVQWIDSVIEDITERRKAQDQLELRVQERTADLAEANHLLKIEIAERRHFETKLRELSEVDYLTGICNRRKLFEIMEAEIGKAHRYHRPLSLIMLDLDHFKVINDTHGHHVGDAVLKALVQVVRTTMRKVDVFARYGGEEFILVCAETGLLGAVVLAEKMRLAIEAFPFPIAGKVTVSAGVAEYRDGDSETAFIEKADAALYSAKRQGRNRVTAAG